jgi:hypothetical protein
MMSILIKINFPISLGTKKYKKDTKNIIFSLKIIKLKRNGSKRAARKLRARDEFSIFIL